LLIAGSGPTDRDGNTPLIPGANNSLKLLAHALAQKGIASLRYDKRGIGASREAFTAEENLRFDTYVEDARAWLRLLRQDSRFSTLVVIGHSEGSLIGMIAAEEGSAQGFVSLEGAGERADRLIRRQTEAQSLEPATKERIDQILAELVAGRSIEVDEPDLQTLFRPTVQPYLISWFHYDPQSEIGKLKVPILIVQGSTDIQVGSEQADALGKGAPGAQTMRLEGMNHVLKKAPADRRANMAAYSDPKLPLAPRLADGIAEFIRAVERVSEGRGK
jgi:pimeloyl-ACP methyl ester carboxylesterase